MKTEIQLRRFETKDTAPLLQLAHETIRTVNAADYTASQCDAWAEGMDEEKYKIRLADSHTIIAEDGNLVVGFVNLESGGHVDNIYTRKGHQSRGIGSSLLKAVEEIALREGVNRLYAEVSVTAKPFFESHGFKVLREELAPYRGEVFRRFEMEKQLAQHG
jgi:GNAT superfamily N-acetyltransferase